MDRRSRNISAHDVIVKAIDKLLTEIDFYFKRVNKKNYISNFFVVLKIDHPYRPPLPHRPLAASGRVFEGILV